ncbi:SdiA-regulated domain-containing protein [Planctomycetota bacterium]
MRYCDECLYLWSSTINDQRSTINDQRLSFSKWLVVASLVCGFTASAFALEPGDIAPVHFTDVSTAGLPDGAEWSGLTLRVVTVQGNAVTRLYAIDGGGTIRLKELNTNGGTLRQTVITGITDPEGLTHVSGNTFAVVDEPTGRIYRFNMETALNAGTFDVAAADTTPVVTSLGNANSGIEGIAYDPVANGFFVLKERDSSQGARGLYTVPNANGSQTATFLFDPGDDISAPTWSLTGLFLTSDDYLYVSAEDHNNGLGEVFRYKVRTGLSLSFDPQSFDLSTVVNDPNYEGVAVDPSGQVIYLVGDDISIPGTDPEFVSLQLPMADFDFNSDGSFTDADINIVFDQIDSGTLSSSYADFYIEDFLYTYYGDANLDREFNSTDLVVIFQAGLYENGDNDDAGWAEGDWTPPNGVATDFDFDSSDFVEVFTSPHYENGPKL